MLHKFGIQCESFIRIMFKVGAGDVSFRVNHSAFRAARAARTDHRSSRGRAGAVGRAAPPARRPGRV